jgi:RNA polymerase sigma-54 factor
MHMKPGMHMKMQQQLVMTPRLQMALKILQVSTLELEQFLKNELLQNPLLERLEEGEETEQEQEEREEREESSDEERTEDEPKQETAEGPEVETERAETEQTEERPEDAGDLDWDDYLDDVYSHAYGQNLERDEDDEVERVPVAIATFEDALKSQLHMECGDEELLGIGEYIIDELDRDGYVRDSVSEMADTLRTTEEKVEKALRIVQSLDPAGIAARNIEECLLNQLARKGMADSLAARVVAEAFDDLKACKHDQIRRKLGVTTDDLREAINIVSKLNPKPRTDPTQPDPAYITPDLIVEEIDGEYVVYLNDSDVPRVRISPAYRRVLSDGASGEERDFISKKLKAARWIVQSIENRRRTMVRVMESIVRAQRGFFERGVAALKPLTLQQIADDVGMHESTVSRVTRGKYVQTPRGTYELKYFFSSGIKTSDGTEMSSKAVKDAMRDIISKENKQKPLSDQKIAGELKRLGFTISRRAVAKYRDQMNILPARLRKEI